MKKKIITALCAITLAFGLTGCQNAIPDMSDEQSAMVVEYAAGLLLKYDKNYENRLVDQKEEAEKEKESKEILETKENDGQVEVPEVKEPSSISQNQVQDSQSELSVENDVVNIGSFLELDPVTVEYQGYEVLDSYTGAAEDELAFGMDAASGAKLVVAKFLLTNAGMEDVSCDIFSKDIRFRINYGNETKNVLTTMLLDDMSQLNETIPAGESMNAVLVIEVKEEEAEEIKELSLTMKYNGNSVTTLLEKP